MFWAYGKDVLDSTLKVKSPFPGPALFRGGLRAGENPAVEPACAVGLDRIEAGDSINTRLKIRDISSGSPAQYEGVVTQTPILSQPFINNVVSLPNIRAKKSYAINVEWRAVNAGNAGKAYLKALELSVLAYEAK